jgi:hypothetical protein
VEIKEHNNALAGPDVLEPLPVLFVNNDRAFCVGDSPMPRHLFDIRPDEANRCKLDLHNGPRPLPGLSASGISTI